MNDFLLRLLLIIGLIAGWILGTNELNSSKIKIKHKSLLNYLLGK